MHAVRCPHCKRILKLDRPVERAKMRCRNCEKVFIGTTAVVAETESDARSKNIEPESPFPMPTSQERNAPFELAPEDPRPSSTTQRPHRARRAHDPEDDAADRIRRLAHRRAPVWPVVIVGVGMVALILVIIAVSYYRTHRRVKGVDKHGNVVYDRRDIRIGHEQELEKLGTKEQYEIRGSLAPKSEDGQDGVFYPPVPGVKPTPGVTPGVTPGPGGAKTPGASPAGPPSDENIKSLGLHLIEGDVEASYLTGEIVNRYPNAVQSVSLWIQAYKRDGKKAVDRIVKCTYVPAGGSARFSLPAGNLTDDEFDTSRSTVTATRVSQLDDLTVCWEIDPAEVGLDATDRTKIVVTGTARNTYPQEVESVKVYVDFFTQEGIHVGQGVGTLEDGVEAIPPSKGKDFRVEYSRKAWGTDVTPQVRVVGRRS
jgi:hypothetical protein